MTVTLTTPAPPPPPQTTGLRAKPRLRRDGQFAVRSHTSYARHRGAVMIWITGAAMFAMAATFFGAFAMPIPALLAGLICLALLILAIRRVRRAMPESDDTLSERFESLAQRMENMEVAGWSTRQSEDIHRSVTEAFGDVVIHRNKAGEITFMNRTAKALFTGTVEMPAIDDTAGLDGRTRIVRVAAPTGEKVFRWGDLASNDPITGEEGIRSFGRDITAERRDRAALETALQEVRAASHERDRVLAMVGHDLRAPAANIVGLTEWLADSDLTPAQRDHVETIGGAARQQLDLLHDVLSEAAANRTKDALRPEPVDLRVLVEGVARTLAPKAHGLAFATRIAPDVATTIMLDGARLRQVLLNLASNAIKFTQTGGVSIELTASAKGIAFAVTDSGPGIPEAERDSVFHDFVRSETAQGTEGTGLGLPIARNWIEAMGGRLGLADVPFGTRVEGFVPVEHALRPMPVPNRRGVVGLSMDDHPARAGLAAALKDLGYTPRIIEEASEVAQCGCVIGDAPVAENRAVPFIATQSGTADSGAAHWLKWPVRLATLDRIVMEACGGQVDRMRYRMLLVEDDPVSVALTRHALLAAGHKVSIVDTLAAARSALSAATFDAVLVDGTLGDGDGVDFISEMAADNAHGPKMVMLSADMSRPRQARAFAAGATGVVAKPLNTELLDDILASRQRVETAQQTPQDASDNGLEAPKAKPALQLVVG